MAVDNANDLIGHIRRRIVGNEPQRAIRAVRARQPDNLGSGAYHGYYLQFGNCHDPKSRISTVATRQSTFDWEPSQRLALVALTIALRHPSLTGLRPATIARM